MYKLNYTIISRASIPTVIKQVVWAIEEYIDVEPVVITLGRKKRNTTQNAKLWVLLKDWSDQVPGGSISKLSTEDWKDILSAAFEGATRYAPNLDNTGLIALGVRTSDFSKGKFSEFIEFIYAEGTKRGIEWSERAIEAYEEYAKAGHGLTTKPAEDITRYLVDGVTNKDKHSKGSYKVKETTKDSFTYEVKKEEVK